MPRVAACGQAVTCLTHPFLLQNCGEYALGMARFFAFADAVNRTGRPIVISTEPFSITPNPLHGQFAHFWRTVSPLS